MKDRFGFDWSKIQGAPYWKKPMLGRRMFFRHVGSAVGGYFLLPTHSAHLVKCSSFPLEGGPESDKPARGTEGRGCLGCGRWRAPLTLRFLLLTFLKAIKTIILCMQMS